MKRNEKLQYLEVVCTTPELSHIAVCLAMVMCVSFDRGWGCSAALSTLALRVRCSTRSVRRALLELRRAGFLWTQYANGVPSLNVPVMSPQVRARLAIRVGTPDTGVRGPRTPVSANSRKYQFKKEGIQNANGTYTRLMEAGLAAKRR